MKSADTQAVCARTTSMLGTGSAGVLPCIAVRTGRIACRMRVPNYTLEPDDQELDAGECTGNPYECRCAKCQAWLIDIEIDREYDERKDAA